VDPGVFARLEKQMPDLLDAMRKSLEESPLRREFEVLASPDRFQIERNAFEYFENVLPELQDKVRILVNRRLVEDISHDYTRRYVISEQLAEYLTQELIDPPQLSAGAPLFQKVGQTWTLAFEGTTIHVPDIIGLGYICELLRAPQTAIESTQLAGTSVEATKLAQLSGIPLATSAAIKAVRAELAAHEKELAALPKNDWTRRGVLQDQIGKLKKYLNQVEAHRGRVRKVAGTAQRSRTSVTNAINRAIDRISGQHPALATHLKKSITMGIAPIYAPVDLPDWRF
jgi:hypothetical protein